MVSGIIDILKKVKDKENRMEIANDMVAQFKREKSSCRKKEKVQPDRKKGDQRYAQEHILVSVVKIVRKLPQDMLEIQLETPTMMSHRNGTTAYSDKFVIHKDGHVMYFNEGENEPRNWSSYIPKWEYTRYPVLPVVVEGLPEEEQPPAAKEPPPAAKRTCKTL